MSKENGNSLLKYSVHLIRMVTIALGLAAGYFMTIQSIRLELAAKAETVVVETLDKKLANIEIMLRESVLSKEQFYLFSKDIESRLVRIEQHLINRTGDNVEKR